MILIIGGANQSKFEYAKSMIKTAYWCDGAASPRQDLFQAPGIRHLEVFIQNALAQGDDVSAFADELYKENPDAVIICQEIGYGLVPMSPEDRAYREAVGRICTVLAAHSDEVHRVVCGIGTVIKHG